MPRMPDRFQEFARLGAAVRLAQLDNEARQIYVAFPTLKSLKRETPTANGATEGTAKPAAARRRKRRVFSASDKKAISDRMKKYWADRKKNR